MQYQLFPPLGRRRTGADVRELEWFVASDPEFLGTLLRYNK